MGDCVMSKIKIQGSSGTGTTTITSAVSNTDKTITLPDSTTTLVGSDTAVVKDSSGNVGIGVTPKPWHSAFQAIQVGSATSLFSEVALGSGGSSHLSQNAYYDGAWKTFATGKASTIRQSAGAISFYVNENGTTTAGSDPGFSNIALQINNSGRVDFQNDPSVDGNMNWKNRGGGSGTIVRIYSNSTQVGSIGTSTSATAYYTSSDYRLKENVVPMSGSIDRLKQLKPSRFNFISDVDKTVDGFLAHEAGEVVPECVSGDKDAMRMEEYEVTPAVMDGMNVITEAVMGEREVPDYQGIDQAKLVPLLVGAIQELTARLEVLEAN